MESVNATSARANLYKLIEKTVGSSSPIQITSKGGDVVMMSVSDYQALQETVYLSGIPGMLESLAEGMSMPIAECIAEEAFVWPDEAQGV